MLSSMFDFDELDEAEVKAEAHAVASAESNPGLPAPAAASAIKALPSREETPAPKSEPTKLEPVSAELLPAAPAPGLASERHAAHPLAEVSLPRAEPAESASVSAEPLPAVPGPAVASESQTQPSGEDGPALASQPAEVVKSIPAETLSATPGCKAPFVCEETPAPRLDIVEVHPASDEPLPASPAPTSTGGEAAQPSSSEALAPHSEPIAVQPRIDEDKGSSASLSTAASDAGSILKASNNLADAHPQCTVAASIAADKDRRGCFGLASCGLWRMLRGAPAGLTR